MLFRKLILAGAAFISMVPFCMAQSDGFRKQLTQPVDASITLRQNTQKQETRWREDQQVLTARFDQLTAEQRQLYDRRDGLQRDMQSARARIAEKGRQLKEIRAINQRIEPFLLDLAVRLQHLIDAGLPFLPRERRQRIHRQSDLLGDPEVTVSKNTARPWKRYWWKPNTATPSWIWPGTPPCRC